ncbi:MAG: hypothetical protein AAB381_00015 [Patescibacteria group bacterium]
MENGIKNAFFKLLWIIREKTQAINITGSTEKMELLVNEEMKSNFLKRISWEYQDIITPIVIDRRSNKKVTTFPLKFVGMYLRLGYKTFSSSIM